MKTPNAANGERSDAREEDEVIGYRAEISSRVISLLTLSNNGIYSTNWLGLGVRVGRQKILLREGEIRGRLFTFLLLASTSSSMGCGTPKRIWGMLIV